MDGLQWWCSAQSVAWSWNWRAYPGVWLYVLLLVGGFLLLLRHARSLGVGPAIRPRRTWAGVAGLLLVWVALDWPVGALGGGYLASLHMTQFLLLAMVAPPLILLGIPAEAARNLLPEGAPGGTLRRIASPFITLAVFNVIIFATHLPVVSDALMRSQPGSFIIDTLWLGGGILYWWPIVGPGVPRPRFTPPLRIAYLFATMMFMTAPGAMITFADLPLFATYELAPRVGTISALGDQRLAGLLMKIGGAVITWVAISIIFYRWQLEENRLLERDLARVRQAEG